MVKIILRGVALIVFFVPFFVMAQNQSVNCDKLFSASYKNKREVQIEIEPIYEMPKHCNTKVGTYIGYYYQIYVLRKKGHKTMRPDNNQIIVLFSANCQVGGFNATLKSKFFEPKPGICLIDILKKIISDDDTLSYKDVSGKKLFLEAVPYKDINMKNCPVKDVHYVYIFHNSLFSKEHKHYDLSYLLRRNDQKKATDVSVKNGSAVSMKSSISKEKETDSVRFHITYKKLKVYDTLRKVPGPHILSIPKAWFKDEKMGPGRWKTKSMSPFIGLPASVSLEWTALDYTFSLNDTIKTVYIERRTFSQSYFIVNRCNNCRDWNSKTSFKIINHDFKPIKKNKKGLSIFNNKSKNNVRQNFSSGKCSVTEPITLKLNRPFRFLEGDSVYVTVYKPFGFTIHNSGELSRYNSWKSVKVVIDFKKNDSCILNWVHLKPLMVFYVDLSDLKNRQGTIDTLNKVITKLRKDTVSNQFVFYISNSRHPLVFTSWKDINKAFGIIRDLSPESPNVAFDRQELCKYIVSGRRAIQYNFYLSDGTFASSKKFINKHLIQEFGVYLGKLNEDDLSAIVRKINSQDKQTHKQLSVNIFIHNSLKNDALPPSLTGEDINYGTW